MRQIALLAALLAAGCVFTHRTGTSEGPIGGGVYGQAGFLVVHSGTDRNKRLIGELLWVRDSTLLLVHGQAIVLVPYAVVRGGRFGPIVLRAPFSDPGPLRRYARYPDGLTATGERKLLAGYGQVSPIMLDPPIPTERGSDAHAAPETLTTFLRAAQASGDRFSNLGAAIAAGYRRLGPSFPGMGEHWIHPGLIVSGEVDPARPPVLCYVRVDGEARLVAAAFTVPLEDDEAPPEFPAGRDVWHDHAASVDEESLLLAHPASHRPHAAGGGDRGPRLAMFHAWLWLDNPEGILAQNNWRLPFMITRIDIGDAAPSADAARALSLVTAGPEYYVRLFSAAAGLQTSQAEALDAILDGNARRVRSWANGVAHRPVAPDELASLERIWASLWEDVRASVSDATFIRLDPLR